MRTVALVLMFAVASANAAGPVAPRGWDGSFAQTLPNGHPCCLPADLNGTGLVGGAFVLLSSDKKQFGLFALTYTPPLKEHWELLEKHPIDQLSAYRVSLEASGRHPHGGIRACASNSGCKVYYLDSRETKFKVAADEG
jgi:hypothetical protein